MAALPYSRQSSENKWFCLKNNPTVIIKITVRLWSEWRELECKRSPAGLLIAQIANDSIIRTACSAICGLFVCKSDQRNRKCQMTLPISWSEWRDSNPRPLGPEPSAHTKLSYTPMLFDLPIYYMASMCKSQVEKGHPPTFFTAIPSPFP